MRVHDPSRENLSEAVAQLFPTFDLAARKCLPFSEVFPYLRFSFDRLVPWSVVCTHTGASRTSQEDGCCDDR